jgi:ubiquinone/menaquinone biosynthesis C-methylase UbiE
MDKQEYKNMYHAEDTHFYYVSLHKLILQLIKKYSNYDNQLKILDAGCGTGRLAELMSKIGTVTGIDMSDEALQFAKERNITVQKASVMKLPFKDNSFDIVTSIDVLYHKNVTDDIKALKELYRVVKPGGIVIVRLQAIPWLTSSHDKVVHSKKRYAKKEVEGKLIESGFHIEKLSYMNMTLVPIAMGQHIFQKFLPPSKNHSSISEVNSFINMSATGVLTAENTLLHTTNLPFGLGIIAVARK